MDAVLKKSTSKLKKLKKSVEVKLQQLLWNLRGETLNMAWTSNNYKNVQSLMKWSGLSHPQQRVTFRPAISRSKTKKKKGELNAWCCVCFWLFRLSVCKCAVCVCGSLHVCFHQRRCVFSMSYTNDSLGAGVFNFSDVFFLSFHPEKGKKGFSSDVFFSCQVNIHVDLS